MSLRKKIILLCLGLSVIPVLIFGSLTYFSSKRTMDKEVEARIADNVNSIHTQIESLFSTSSSQMTTLITLFERMLNSNGIDDVSISDVGMKFYFADGAELILDGEDHSLIDTAANEMGQGIVATIFRVENGEAIRHTTNIQNNGKRAVGTKLGKKVLDITVGQKRFYSGYADILGTSYITAYKPVTNKEGQVKAILFVGIADDVNPTYQMVSTIVKSIKVGKTGYAYVLDKNGTFVVHPNSEGKNVANLSFIKKMLDEKEGYIAYDWKGEAKVAAYQHYKGRDWIIAAGTYVSEFEEALRNIKKLVFGAVFVILIVCIICALLFSGNISNILSEIVRVMIDTSEQTVDTANQLSNASQQISAGATEQAASLEETSSSLDEMNSMVNQNADNAQLANQLAQEAKQSASEGNDAMTSMNNAMVAVNDSSEEISKIIKTIEEIAFQTNLLALNAAVEAARAGEHGKGFAVVADEVRNLAQRAASAARDTSGLIESNVEHVKASNNVLISAVNALDKITGNSNKVADIIAEIATASREQAEGLKQITNAVSQMDQVTQQNASAAEESAASAESLHAHSETLNHMIEKLNNVVTG